MMMSSSANENKTENDSVSSEANENKENEQEQSDSVSGENSRKDQQFAVIMDKLRTFNDIFFSPNGCSILENTQPAHDRTLILLFSP